MDYLQIRELYHDGIKGMKWGIRRYQNYDGTLTEEGRHRYNKKYDDDRAEGSLPTKDEDGNYYYTNKKGKKTLYKTRSEQLSDEELTDLNRRVQQENKLASETSDAYEYKGPKADQALRDASRMAKDIADALPKGNGKVIKKDYSNLSDQELRDRINRLQLEDSYGRLSGDTKYVKSGSEKTREILQTVGSVLAIAGSAAGLAYTIRKMREGNNTNTAKHSDILDIDNFLAHHGILGQKWGVRRFQNPDGSLTEEGKNRYNEDSQKLADMATSNAELEDLTRKYVLRNALDDAHKNNTKIVMPKDDKKLWEDAYQLFRNLKGKYAEDNISTEIRTLDDGTDYIVSSIYDKKLGGTMEYYEPLLYDSNGKKYDEKNRLYNTTKSHNLPIIHSDELMHHGIKGQKWGLRRYQNDDGTLTEAGRLRYGGKTHVDELDEDELNDLHAAREYQHKKKLAIGIGLGVGSVAAITAGATWLARRSQQRTDILNKQNRKNDRNIAELIDILDSKSSSSYHMHEPDKVKPNLFSLPAPKSSASSTNKGTVIDAVFKDVKKTDYHMHQPDRVKPNLFSLPTPKSSSNTSSYHMHEPDRVKPNLFSLPAPKSSKAYVKNGALYQYRNGKETLLGGGANSRYEYTTNSAGQILKTVKKNFKPSWLGHSDASDYLIFREAYLSSFNTLAHHGIKGQKWGVRRYQDQNGSLTSEGKERYRTNQGTKEIIGNSDTYSKLVGSHKREYVNYGKTSGAKRGFLIGLGTGAAAGAGKTIFETALNRNKLGSGEYTTNRVINRFVRNTILGAFGGSVVGTLFGSVAGKKSAQAKLADKGQEYTNELLNTPIDRIARRR